MSAQDGVAVADEGEHLFQLRPGGAAARSVVSERAVQRDAVELPVGVLVQAAHPRVADPLTDDASPGKKCQAEPLDLPAQVSIKQLPGPNLTLRGSGL